MQLLLLSNSTNYDHAPLAHAYEALSECYKATREVTFLGFAQRNRETYTAEMTEAFAPIGLKVRPVPCDHGAHSAIRNADAFYVGGGNTFRLLKALHDLQLLEEIRNKVHADTPYAGDSAGAIIAGPSIRTSNDMPIVEPRTFCALGLLPFEINPHYIEGVTDQTHMGETRDQRIADYLDEGDRPVLGLREGGWLRVNNGAARLEGPASGRLFRPRESPVDLSSGADLTYLLKSSKTTAPG